MEYVCAHCGNTKKSIVDMYKSDDGMVFCSFSCRKAWEANHPKNSSNGSSSNNSGGSSSYSGGGGGTLGGAIGGAITGAIAANAQKKAQIEIAEKEAKDARIRQKELDDKADAAEIKAIELPEDKEGIEDYLEDMFGTYSRTSNKPETKAAVVQSIKKGFRHYKKIADKEEVKQLEKKWRKIKLLKLTIKNPIFWAILFIAIFFIGAPIFMK